jgi:small subunit ribosomal protein S20
MPHVKRVESNKKSLRQDKKRRIRNRIVRGTMRKAIKTIRSENNPKAMLDLLPGVFSAIDKAAKKGVIHKNTASRYKSRLTKYVQKAQTPA